MSESRGGFGWIPWVLAIALLLVAAWFFTPLSMFFGISSSIRNIHQFEARLQKPEIYLPVATNLALYCQSRQELHLTNEQEVDASKLPPPLPSLGSQWPWGEFQNNSAFVEFGGGFYHFGYSLQLNQTRSNSGTNVWELFLDREDQPEKFLCSVALAPSSRISPGQYASNTIAEYNRRLSESPRDLNLLREKLAFLLQYEPDEVRASCTNAINVAPDNWWPHLTLALVDTGRGNYSEAAQELKKFTESKPSYSRYIYLAYFYHLNDKPRDAAEAIEKAISFPVIDLADDDCNTECRGYWAGVYAFRNGDYKTVIKLCDALLPVKENGDYAKAALSFLKSAAESATAGSQTNFTPNPAVLEFNPYEGIDVQRLLKGSSSGH